MTGRDFVGRPAWNLAEPDAYLRDISIIRAGAAIIELRNWIAYGLMVMLVIGAVAVVAHLRRHTRADRDSRRHRRDLKNLNERRR
jgi:hypothetical protein